MKKREIKQHKPRYEMKKWGNFRAGLMLTGCFRVSTQWQLHSTMQRFYEQHTVTVRGRCVQRRHVCMCTYWRTVLTSTYFKHTILRYAAAIDKVLQINLIFTKWSGTFILAAVLWTQTYPTTDTPVHVNFSWNLWHIFTKWRCTSKL